MKTRETYFPLHNLLPRESETSSSRRYEWSNATRRPPHPQHHLLSVNNAADSDALVCELVLIAYSHRKLRDNIVAVVVLCYHHKRHFSCAVRTRQTKYIMKFVKPSQLIRRDEIGGLP